MYLITHRKGGAARDVFDPPRYWSVRPDGQYRFTGPVILLTHRFSISAAENLALAMRTLPNVTVVGETTCGVMADVYGFQLPNGWFVHCAYKLFTDHKGFCWEGIGIPPDLRITNSAEDIKNGRDRVLEFALDLAHNANLSPRERAPESATETHRSLADDLRAATSTAQIERLISRADQFQHDSLIYLNPYELAVAGEDLAHLGRVDDAIIVLTQDTASFPSHWRGHFTLGNVLLDRGDTANAKRAFSRSMDVNPLLFPWQRDAYKTAERVLDDIVMIERILERFVDDSEEFERMLDWAQAYVDTANDDQYHVDTERMNDLGYSLLRRDRLSDALRLFEFNTTLFPDSWNTFDSYGEALLQAADTTQAVTMYERSLELNPYNGNARAVLEKIGKR
ncbi:MAG: hypothetical protein GF341_04460 [candidate division Zixibacteria bacterium]|nr:hypothetical protein [candidate division Zixibacteria bacterium]